MGNDLVLLTECGDGLEAAGVRSVLASEGIGCVIQGEHHASLLGGATMATPIAPRVLVRGEDLERAMTALEGTAQVRAAICAVHEVPATRACVHCGVAMCAACDAGQCESCSALSAMPPPTPTSKWLAIGVPVVMLVLVVLMMEYLGVVPD